jgi:flagellar hook-associated protein 2
MLSTVNPAGGRYRILSDVGIKLGDGAKLEFDEGKFREAFGKNPEAVRELFTTTETGIGAIMEKRITKLVDPVSGVITRQNKTLDTRTAEFQDRIKNLDKLLTAKRERLERQFANLESSLSNLQSQQQAISQIQTIRPVTNSRR